MKLILVLAMIGVLVYASKRAYLYGQRYAQVTHPCNTPKTRQEQNVNYDEFNGFIAEQVADSKTFAYSLEDTLVRTDLIKELVSIRRLSGLSIDDVVTVMGRPATHLRIALIESGDVDPHLSTLQRYAMALGTRIDFQIVSR